MRSLMVIVALVALPLPALALDDPDTEVARKHFEKGRVAYDSNDYATALKEFEAAKRAKGAPALDFNIARCHDRLENYAAAIEHYQLYVSAQPGASDAAEVRARMGALKRRLDEASTRPPETPPARPDAPERLLITPNFSGDPTQGLTAVPGPTPEQEARARRRRNGAIIGGVVGGVIVIAGVVTLAVLLSQSGTPPLTRSDLGPWTVTK
jgi:tetratricopeptide (TPR) repeat protein